MILALFLGAIFYEQRKEMRYLRSKLDEFLSKEYEKELIRRSDKAGEVMAQERKNYKSTD